MLIEVYCTSFKKLLVFFSNIGELIQSTKLSDRIVSVLYFVWKLLILSSTSIFFLLVVVQLCLNAFFTHIFYFPIIRDSTARKCNLFYCNGFPG